MSVLTERDGLSGTLTPKVERESPAGGVVLVILSEILLTGLLLPHIRYCCCCCYCLLLLRLQQLSGLSLSLSLAQILLKSSVLSFLAVETH